MDSLVCADRVPIRPSQPLKIYQANKQTYSEKKSLLPRLFSDYSLHHITIISALQTPLEINAIKLRILCNPPTCFCCPPAPRRWAKKTLCPPYKNLNSDLRGDQYPAGRVRRQIQTCGETNTHDVVNSTQLVGAGNHKGLPLHATFKINLRGFVGLP
jgi:hypothetical protein